jgi:hypothetical protein
MQSNKFALKFFVLALLSTSTFIPVFSQTNESALAEIVRQTRAIDPSAKLHATINGDEVTITSESMPKSNDDACKVQAILVAKALFDSQPDSIQKTKVILFDYPGNKCRTIVIKRAEIKLYASNGMSEKALLSSVDFTVTSAGAGGAPTDLKVVDGPLQNERLLLLGRITRMKAAGTNVTAFMSIFNDLEAAAATNDQGKTQAKLEYVADKVDEQEKVIRAAKSSVTKTSSSGSFYSNSRPTGGGGSGLSANRQADASAAADLTKMVQEHLNNQQMLLFALASRQQQLSARITTFKVVRPGFIGNDEQTIARIQGLIEQHQLIEADREMKVLENKYAQAGN